MPSGGARTRSGPPPDPNALRRDRDGAEWTVLPAEGRQKDSPRWPLFGQTGREAELWERLWHMPQAVVWESARQDIEVALYVRNLALVELPDAPVNLGTLVRQMSDALGLSIPGMRANRWRIAADELVERRAASRAAPARPSARDRLKAVRSAADAG